MPVPTAVRSNVGITVGMLRAALRDVPDDALVMLAGGRARAVEPRADRVLITRRDINDSRPADAGLG